MADTQHRLSRQQIIEHVRKSVLYTAFDVKWVPQSATLTVVGQYANNNGALSFYQLQKGELETLAELRLRNPIKCCTYGHNAPNITRSTSTIALGDFVGDLRVLDVDRVLTSTSQTSEGVGGYAVTDVSDATILHVPHAHKSIINAIDGARFSGPPEIATASRDGAVRIWDTRQATKPVVALTPADESRARDCWAVRLGNSFDVDERVVAAGYDNGDIKIFDLRTQKMLHEMNVSNGVCGLEFDRADIAMNKLMVSSLEGRVRCYDMRTLHPTLGYAYVEQRVSDGTVWCSSALPQNRDVFVSGGGGELTLSQYRYPPERTLKDAEGVQRGVAGVVDEINRVKVGDQPINAIDWNRSKEGLLACTSFDQSIRILLVTRLSLLR